MAEYPIGLWDEATGLPLVRRATTATHPAVDFRGWSAGLLDLAWLAGSAGAPVVVFGDAGPSPDDTHAAPGDEADQALPPVAPGPGALTGGMTLLGVLSAGAVLKAGGVIELRHVSTRQFRRSPDEQMTPVAAYVKAREILRLAEPVREVAELG